MQSKPIVSIGLELGSTATRCAICTLEHERIRFLGCGLAPAGGWSKSRIADQNRVTASVLEAVHEAEADAQVSAQSAVVGMGGLSVRGANSRGVVELGRPREIEQRDVNRVVDRAARVQLQEDRMVLQLFPQDFVVDDQPGLRDPRKMLAWRLEANAHLITASIQEHNAIVGAVNQAHLSVDETVFEALAASYAAVLPEERREGVAVVNIGAQSTDMVVYYGDALQLATTLAICGDHFTRDIARCLCISFEDAALVKHEYGCAVADYTALNSVVEVPGPDGRDREMPRRKLGHILQARSVELFTHVQRELARVGMDRALMGGVVLTGGGANLPDICEVAERVLGCQAQKGLALGIQGWPEALHDPAWTSTAGLAMYAARISLQAETEKQSAGILGRILR